MFVEEPVMERKGGRHRREPRKVEGRRRPAREGPRARPCEESACQAWVRGRKGHGKEAEKGGRERRSRGRQKQET